MDKELKDNVRKKLNLLKEFSEEQDYKTINEVKEVDGKIKANFSIRIPPKKKGSITEYRDKTKFFDSFDDFAEYAKGFFAAEINFDKE